MTAPRTTTEPFWDLVDQSLEEAAFLWKRWETDLDSLTRNLDEVWSWTEDRLQGTLDGVRVAGERIVEVTESALHGKDASARTVAAHVLAGLSPAGGREALAATIRETRGPALQSIARGIETAALDGSFASVTAVLAAGDPEHGAALCRIKAFRRSPPGRELLVALESNVPSLQVEAMRALRVAADESLTRHLDRGLRSDSPEVRRAAIEAGIRQRVPAAWDAVIQLAERRDPACGRFLTSLAALGSPQDQQLVISALREPALQRPGLFALPYIGTPEAAEICVAGMRDERLARWAGEAYCAITGVELMRDGLADREPPDGDSLPALADDALDADLVPRQSDLWPRPDLAAVRRHWASIKARYSSGVRHWRGRVVDLDTLLDAVERGPMHRRQDLIDELAVRTEGRFDLEPRAFAPTQRAGMRAARVRLARPMAR